MNEYQQQEITEHIMNTYFIVCCYSAYEWLHSMSAAAHLCSCAAYNVVMFHSSCAHFVLHSPVKQLLM